MLSSVPQLATSLPKAPPLSGQQWLHSPPLDAETFHGRVVVLLFWATSCEASWVRLRQLETLHARHGDAIAVVAVHSPRFEYEQDVDLLKSTIAQRGLTVPVLHDPELETWARYGPTGRPTVVVVNPHQRVLGAMVGTDESSLIALDEIAAQQAKLVDRTIAPLPERVFPAASSSLGQLRGPTSLARSADGSIICLDPDTGRLFTLEHADGGHLAVRRVFGSMHGAGSVAARSDGTISISFPERGVVESIDLGTKKRRVIADDMIRPLGLAEDADGSLVVCDAGADQLVRITKGRFGPIANDVSQPLDVVRIDAGLLFTEASTGAIRLLGDDGRIRTLNNGRRPGLLDGIAHKAMFQRPSGLATLDDGRVAIIDHGNNRIRVMADRKVATLPVAGLAHPAALLHLGDELLLCSDTRNKRLVLIDMTDHRATALTIAGLPL